MKTMIAKGDMATSSFRRSLRFANKPIREAFDGTLRSRDKYETGQNQEQPNDRKTQILHPSLSSRKEATFTAEGVRPIGGLS